MSSSEKYGTAIGLIGVAVVIIEHTTGAIPAIIGWPIFVACLVAAAVLMIRGRQERSVGQSRERAIDGILGNPAIKGRLEDVSPRDARWIVAKSIEMGWTHGHNDLLELLADRASGVPLNELMGRPCSQCGFPRNKRGKPCE